jgi:hypothetical protein
VLNYVVTSNHIHLLVQDTGGQMIAQALAPYLTRLHEHLPSPELRIAICRFVPVLFLSVRSPGCHPPPNA